MSTVTPEQWSAMNKLVQSFYQKPDAEPFREPVDWQGMGLTDYPKVIKKPMDLGTVKKNIVDRKYKTLQEAADDVKLVWTNCMTYNADGSDFFILAQTLNKKWQEKYRKLMDDFKIPAGAGSSNSYLDASAGGSGGSKVSLEDKRTFAKALYKISKEDLGKILVDIEQKCPAALIKTSAEDELELNVDKLTNPLFSELTAFIKSVGGGKKMKKSNSSGGTKRKATN